MNALDIVVDGESYGLVGILVVVLLIILIAYFVRRL